MKTTQDVTDRIERSIDIDAGAEKVYALVSRPGWWINEGEIDAEPDLRSEGEDHVLVHPAYGEFRLRVAEQDPPRYVAFRWIDPGADAGTLVEFRVAEREGGGVTLSVVESGFAGLGKDRESVLKHLEENTSGWESELAAAQRYVSA